jgi:hypothetical protein
MNVDEYEHDATSQARGIKQPWFGICVAANMTLHGASPVVSFSANNEVMRHSQIQSFP